MLKFLHRSETFELSWRRAVVASAVIFFAATAGAQSKRAEHKGPRGIAVIEFAHAPATGDPPAGTAKLLPVTIFYNGNYYDASLYEASPAPMAVQTGTVYEVQSGGNALGLFTTTMPREAADSWYAVGNWQPTPPESAAKKEPANKPAFENPASNDERPILKRGGSSSQQQQSSSEPAAASNAPSASPSSSSSPSSSGSGDEDRPVLKRPASSNETPPTSPSSAQSTGSQSAGQEQVPSTTAPAYGAEEQDPNRPVLRRGRPRAEPEPAPATTSSARPSPKTGEKTNASIASASAQPQREAAAYVGISDTETTDERPFKYPWTKEQQTKLTAQMSKLALEEAHKYEQQRKLPVGASWEQTSIRAYDLFTDNDGELIFSGTQNISGPRPRKVYVTYSALYDAAGELEPLFSDVTDSEQLDVKGRLELIDAVDSTGNGRGDLLFRRIGISSQKFELYRLTSNGLYKLFDGAVAPI